LSCASEDPDVNLLIYAIDETAPRHAAARTWLDTVLSGPEDVGFAWVVVLAFLRLTTKATVFTAPLQASEALAIVNEWLSQPCASIVHPTERHLELLRGLITPLGTAGNLTADAHLAGLAIEYGAQLCSCDPDFSRFADLNWSDPLRPGS
jgi:uncharacterized protein